MKKFFLLIIFSYILVEIYSQDLIITKAGDTINCNITSVQNDRIKFSFLYNNEIRNTLIPMSSVEHYEKDHFEVAEIKKDTSRKAVEYPQFRIALSFGYSYRTNRLSDNIPEDFVNYMKELKSGFHVDGDIAYYINPSLGFGFKYSMFKSSNGPVDINFTDNSGNIEFGKMSDDLTISFFGPMMSSRFFHLPSSNVFYMNLALGYMGYRNNKVLLDEYTFTGSTLGMAYDIGYDIGISENLFIGLKLSYSLGTLYEYESDDGYSKETIELEEGEYEGLNRFDFSVGLRF